MSDDRFSLVTPWYREFLTPQAFETLCAWYKENGQDHPEKKLELLFLKLIEYLENRGCLLSYECAGETLNRVAKRIDEEKKKEPKDRKVIKDLSGYSHGVAKNVFREYERKQKEIPTDFSSSTPHPAEDTEEATEELDELDQDEKKLDCMRKCLQSLPANERELIMRCFTGEKGMRIKNRQKMANDLQISPNALRIRIFKIRAQMRICLWKCVNKK